MRIMYSSLLLPIISFTAVNQSYAIGQTQNSKPSFTLAICANPDDTMNDESKCGDSTIKDGLYVTLRIKKTNTSDHEIIKWPQTGEPFGDHIEVRDSSGALVGPRKPSGPAIFGGGEGRLSGTKDMVLQPGESKIDFARVGSWFDLSKPGTYTIQVSQHVSSDPGSTVIKSNKVAITVTP